ncbi:MAG: EAL domain-containing protein, partial [Pseudomonadales bacterium]
ITQARLSGGFASYPEDVESPGDLLTAADLALYKTKELRTANITYYTQDLYEESSEWMAISNLLRHQLNRGTLKFYFQQIVHAGDRSVWGHEMLLRLISEDGKVYNTETVIQVAGQMGLMGIIVEKTIACAIDALQNTIHEGAVTINMSPEQIALLTPDQIAKLMAPVSSTLRQRLVIELTEQSLLDSIDVLSPVTQLHKLGYRIALDDFGSGYSAMSCLSSFPLSIVKLDKSLTQDLLVKSNRELLSGITYISEKMGFSVIAEGIETQEQFEMVSDLGCDLAQGYFFGKPQDLNLDVTPGSAQSAVGDV